MKSFRIFMTTVLLLLLTSCSIREEIDLIRAEAGEIAAFFETRTYSRTPFATAAAAEPGLSDSPILIRQTHTEILLSPFNSPDNPVTVASIGKSGESLKTVTAVLTAAEKAMYTGVPRFTDPAVDAVTDAFAKYGIQPKIELRDNPSPAGDVFAVEYAGVTDGEWYYVNRSLPVTLYVSGQKPAKTAVSGDNLVYLTFDDGPTLSDTGELLDVLDLYGVKAAFFTTGEAIEKYPESAKEIAARGHLLGCHSVTHKYDRIYQNADALEAEILRWEQIAADAGISLKTKLFRFPGGSVSGYLTDYKRTTMTAMLAEHGYRIYDWNVVTNDSLLSLKPKETDSYEYIRRTFRETMAQCVRENQGKSGVPIIILMHETVPETVDLMKWMLEYLIEEGFTFGSLADMDASWTFGDRKN